MCGFAGMVTSVGPIGRWRGTIEEAMGTLARRGPDDEGYWSDDERCALGFRRLAILDLSPAASQPMRTPDGRFALVYNGELYNYRELRRELEAEGVPFATRGDTEVVLQSLAHHGEAALSRFNGMFALALYDTRAGTLLLARDHAGIKPLHYLRHREGLFFCSSYEPVLRHPWSRGRSIRAEVASAYFHLGYIPAPHGLLEDTGQLAPGTWVRVDRTLQWETGTFFSFPERPEPSLRGADAVAAVEDAVAAAVRRQMMGDVPVGAFLSGGIDSPLIVANMKKAGADVFAVTIGTGGDVHDESADAARYAEELEVRHLVHHVTPGEARALLEDAVAACGEPFADFSIFSAMLACRVARRNVKVMLAGDGGDELFWGYVQRTSAVLSRARRAWWRRRRGEAPFVATRRRARPGAADLGSHQLRHNSLVAARWLHSVFPGMPPPAGGDLYRWPGGDFAQAASWLRRNEFVGHLTRVLDKVDRASMHESLEVRVPLLDREVVDVAQRIDFESCLDVERGVGKMPLRAALSRHVSWASTQKRGFRPPMEAWLRGSLREPFEDLVLERGEILGTRVRRSAVEATFRRHVERGEDHSWGLWRLLAARLWEERRASFVSNVDA